MNYSELDEVIAARKDSQEVDEDLRERAKESFLFVNKHDGQWEPEIINRMRGRPRYTLDKCNPLIDQIAGEMNNAEFAIKVTPSEGAANKENAYVLDGLIRSIMDKSNFATIRKAATRELLTCGMSAWEIYQDWIDADSFDQGLFIRKINNCLDRVWFDPYSEAQDHSDAEFVILDSVVSAEEFEERFKDAAQSSLSESRSDDAYSFKKSKTVTIGRIYYKKAEKIELVRMNDGSVYRVDDDFNAVIDELAANGIVEESRRRRDVKRVYSRLFSNNEWLTEPEQTAFDDLPVVAIYGNYSVYENKRIWRGAVEYWKDAQRIYNYSVSKQVEEGALSPRMKYWMTNEQAAGHERQLQRMNVSADPVQFYNHVEGMPPPFQQGGSQINQGLQLLAQQSAADINAAAGLFSSNLGDNPGLQSGVALDIQTDKGNNSMVKWIEALEIGICFTGRALIKAIPRVYDSTRQVSLFYEDGTRETQTINQPVYDQQTGQIITLNNLAAGEYDASCEAGLAFKTRQREEKAQFIELAQIMPEIVQLAGDVLLKNVDGQGMQDAAERLRLQMINSGMIPESQMTDEELRMVQKDQQQAAQQPQQDANMILAQAEMGKAQAEQQNAANKSAEIQGKQQLAAAQIQIEAQKVQLEQQRLSLELEKFKRAADDKFNVAAAQIQQGQQKLDLQAQKQALDADIAQQQAVLAAMQERRQQFNDDVSNLGALKDAIGANVIIGQNVEAYSNQVDEVIEQQRDL